MDIHATKEERQALETLTSFSEMADIAINVLKRMQRVDKLVGQVCGPISTGGLGGLKPNVARFKQAIERGRQNGLHLFNQMPFQEAMIRLVKYEDTPENRDGTRESEANKEILNGFFLPVFSSGFIQEVYFLPDWQSSFGSRRERDWACLYALKIREYPVDWLT